ncbi:CoA-binding domain containing protein [Nitzschia inconspicua]|uniref:CoA-binding domain containing protein n=1 Tax=Nitzschia inconspicua TaxID=303405 RepID=A0A9K3Q0U7_9STRA|nr:CoA-binding domain containing protein [Nitzschia inconspicua]
MHLRALALASALSSSFSMMISALQSEATIRKILTNSKTIALVGASAKPERPSNYVMKFLLDHNYDVIPINPGLEGQVLYGKTVFASLSSIPKSVQVDMVDIFRNSAQVPPIVDEAIEIGAKYIWMQVGVTNIEAAEKARKAGLEVVQDACPKVQIPVLGITGPSISSEL